MDLRVVEDSDDRLVVRTRMMALWLGLPALAMFCAVVAHMVFEVGRALWALNFAAAILSFGTGILAAAFMSLFLIGFLSQRLIATRETVEVLSKVGPFVWRRRRFETMTDVHCVANVSVSDDGADTYELELDGYAGKVKFGPDHRTENIQALADRLCVLCRVCRPYVPPPPEENSQGGANPQPVFAKRIKRQEKKKKQGAAGNP